MCEYLSQMHTANSWQWLPRLGCGIDEEPGAWDQGQEKGGRATCCRGELPKSRKGHAGGRPRTDPTFCHQEPRAHQAKGPGTLLPLLPFFPSLNCVSLGRMTVGRSRQRQQTSCFYMTPWKSPHGLLGYLLKTNKGSDNQWIEQHPQV